MVDGCLALQATSVLLGDEICARSTPRPFHSAEGSQQCCAAASPADIEPDDMEAPGFRDAQILSVAITQRCFVSGDERVRKLSHYRCVSDSFPSSDLMQKCNSTMSNGAVAALDASLEQSINNIHVDR